MSAPDILFFPSFVDLFDFSSAHEVQEPSATFYTPQNVPSLIARLDKLTDQVKQELDQQGFKGSRVKVERMLNMRFEGTDTSLMVLPQAKKTQSGEEEPEDYLEAFKRVYKTEFGFVLEGKPVIVDDIKVRGIGKTFDDLGASIYEEVEELHAKEGGLNVLSHERGGACSVVLFPLFNCSLTLFPYSP